MVLWRRILGTPLGRRVLGWVFEHMSFVLPVQRLYETKTLLAFYHPAPAYPVHILIVPKQAVASFDRLDVDGDEFARRFWLEAAACAQNLAGRLNLAQGGYRLVVNGGDYQDIPQLHVHLIAGQGF